MTARWKITVEDVGKPDREGRQSFTLVTISPAGERSAQTYNANLAAAIRRLRYNIAEQFWFDRMRIRLAREANR